MECRQRHTPPSRECSSGRHTTSSEYRADVRIRCFAGSLVDGRRAAGYVVRALRGRAVH